METKAQDFVRNEMLKNENRIFVGKIITISVFYLVITLLLNHIRTTASLWIVWPLIIIQFVLYFSIFVATISRAKVFGLKNWSAFIIFLVLAVLGRINDWEMIIIPITVLVMTILSVMNKKLSAQGQFILMPKNEQ